MPRTTRSTILFLFLLALFASPVSAGDPLTYNAQAQALLNRGEYDKALDELKSGFSLFPYD